jgi:NitT/TauT family transport system permease protein
MSTSRTNGLKPRSARLATAVPPWLLHICRRHQDLLLGTLTVGTFLVAWELAARLNLVKPIFISSPTRIVEASIWLFAHGLWHDIWVSAQEFLLGFGLAICLGIPLGIALGWSRPLRAMLEPFVVVLYSIPRIALLPLTILWLGIGLASKVAIVFLGAVFPITVNVMSGIRTVDETLVRCARSFGASDRQLLLTVSLPGTVPFMITGMRLGAGRALVGIVVSELVVSSAGIGHMMSRAGATFQTDKVFVGVILLAIFGLLFSQSLRALEKRVDSWRPRQ